MKRNLLLLTLAFAVFSTNAHSQLFKINLDEKVNASTLIAEGQVTAQKSFWNAAHTMIFTANTVQLYKTFKGNAVTQTIEIVTQGGSVGSKSVQVSELLTLNKNQVGIFFCHPNSINLTSPTTGRALYDVYSSDQGFLRYDFTTNTAYAPFASYTDIENSLYTQVQKLTGQNVTVIDASFSVAAMVKKQSIHRAATNGINGLINSFSPTTVHGGTLNDPINNTLTISGSGFGSAPSGSCAINFIDGNSNVTTPTYAVAYNSPYVVSWSDSKIVIKVPSRAATGPLAVVLSDGTVIQSSQSLTVAFSVLNDEFDFSSLGIDTTTVSEPRLMNANGSGGYTYQFSASTLGGGKNFASDPAAATFARAVATWQQLVGANLTQGSSTATQAVKDDNINVVEYDNNNTGVPVMAAGVLEATYSWGSTCYSASPFSVGNAQKTGFDILVRNPGVSTGAVISIEDGPCAPDNTSSYDLESIILHEIGHVLNLAHINDGYQQYPAGTIHINPGKVMHYAIVNYVDRRSPDNAAYTGALYTVTPQDDAFGSCGLYSAQMSQKSYTVISNDECPSSFPTTPTPPGTIVSFDLVHATSNELKDPAFTQVDCEGEGESVTNNAWYALKTTSENDGVLSLTVSGYTTTPSTLSSCTDQGVRLAVYQVSSCPGGQAFPAPINCATFTGNGNLPNIGSLLPNQTYLLYFDGLRNTKAAFNITMNGSALPIVLSQFSGEYIKSTDQLYIEIQQAINVKNIVIEKSGDSYGFTQIGTLQVLPTQLVGKHTYIDAQPFAGNNFYRLKIIDNDGNFTYSNIIKLTNGAGPLVYIYPNPVVDKLSISLSGLQAGQYNFTVYDVAGKAQLKNTYAITEGSQSLSIPVQRIARGMYIIKITNAKGVVIAQQKLIKE